MKFQFPTWLVTAALMAAVAFLQYILNHVADLHVSEVYAPLIVAAASWLIKLIQERNPEATPRSISEPERPSYWKRVLYK